jgi:AcrR family transcriptional regulator
MLRVADSAKPAVEETRVRILAAARELFASKGSRGTTTREVADRAGVNEATVFRHFGTKQQLLSAMLEHFNRFDDIPRTLERIRGLATIEEQLRELAHASVDSIKRKEDLIRVAMAEELSNPEWDRCAWRSPNQVRVQLRQFFRERVEAGALQGEAEWLARTFMSLFFAFVVARRIWDDLEVSPDEAIDKIVSIFLNGAKAR